MLIFYMISQGCVVKMSCDSMGDFLKFQVLRCLSKFHVHRPCQRGCVTLFFCHVTTHHQVVRGSCNSIVGFLSLQVPNLPCLVVIELAEGEIQVFTRDQRVIMGEFPCS